jgi:hypothetical protein
MVTSTVVVRGRGAAMARAGVVLVYAVLIFRLSRALEIQLECSPSTMCSSEVNANCSPFLDPCSHSIDRGDLEQVRAEIANRSRR